MTPPLSPPAVAAVALVLAIGACTPGPVGAPRPVAVHTVTVRVQVVEAAMRFSAIVQPRQTVELSFKVPGTVERLHRVATETATGETGERDVQEGDVVAKGTALAALEQRDFAREVEAAEAHLARAEASLRRARIAGASARREQERIDGLFTQRVTTEAQKDDARSRVEAAEADVVAAEKERNALEVALAQARDRLEDCTLIVPIESATVVRKQVEPQERVAAGTRAFAVMDCTTVRVVFGAPDGMLMGAGAGAPAPVRLGATLVVLADALPGERFTGEVTKIAPAADPVTRTFPTEVSLANADGRLRPGTVVTLVVGESTEAVLLPLTAIRRGDRPDEAVVFRARDDGGKVRAERRRVVLGGVWDNQAQVVLERSEVALGDRIVAVGAARLDDGQEVRILDAPALP